jgi:ATP-dependent Clp protease protease subunit
MPSPKQQDYDDFQPPKVLVYCISRRIYMFDEINDASVCEMIKILDVLELQNPKKPIEILLSTVGGCCYAGLALYDRLRYSKCKIIIISTGLTASMGVVILLAGAVRYATKNVHLLTHQVSSSMSGKTTDLGIDYDETKRLNKICNSLIAERTNQSLKQIEREIKIGDKYISAEEALKKGYIHKIIEYAN